MGARTIRATFPMEGIWRSFEVVSMFAFRQSEPVYHGQKFSRVNRLHMITKQVEHNTVRQLGAVAIAPRRTT